MNRTEPRRRPFRPKKEWQRVPEGEWGGLIESLALDRIENTTRDNYETAIQSWKYFNNMYDLENAVPTLHTIKMYIAELHISGYPYGTIKDYLAGLGFWMSTMGLEHSWETITKQTSLKHLKDGLKKRDGRSGVGAETNRKPALPVEQLTHMCNSVDYTIYDDLLLVTLASVAFYGLCRLGEVVWPDAKAYQLWRKVIKRTDITLEVGRAVVHLPYMKNDRFYHGSDITLTPFNRSTNPVSLLRRYLLWRDEKHPGHPALFVMEGGEVPTRAWFLERFRAWCGEQYAGHSLRAGGATFLAEMGASTMEIMRAGRWRSDVFLCYIRKNSILGEVLRRRNLWDGNALLL